MSINCNSVGGTSKSSCCVFCAVFHRTSNKQRNRNFQVGFTQMTQIRGCVDGFLRDNVTFGSRQACLFLVNLSGTFAGNGIFDGVAFLFLDRVST